MEELINDYVDALKKEKSVRVDPEIEPYLISVEQAQTLAKLGLNAEEDAVIVTYFAIDEKGITDNRLINCFRFTPGESRKKRIYRYTLPEILKKLPVYIYSYKDTYFGLASLNIDFALQKLYYKDTGNTIWAQSTWSGGMEGPNGMLTAAYKLLCDILINTKK